jgi:hypothetical protein
MTQFEFETKEQREAWRVTNQKLFGCFSIHDSYETIREKMNKAASRFDAREATCGIEPLSEGHALLLLHHFQCGSIFTHKETVQNFIDNGLAVVDGNMWRTTDKGREVLSNLNAMCKVEK